MVVKDTTKLFTCWRRVVRLHIQIPIGVKTGSVWPNDDFVSRN